MKLSPSTNDGEEVFTCKKCGEVKPSTDFRKLSNGYYVYTCKECRNEIQKEKRKDGDYDKYKGRYRQRLKNWKLEREYGITLEQFNKLKELHLNGCAICKKELPLHVDHNHTTGKVRGLLCINCNNALGLLYEDEDIIWNLLEYIKEDGFVKAPMFGKEVVT